MSEIRRAAVIGAGLMGHGLAQLFAQAGIPVRLTDNEPERLKAGVHQIEENLKTFVQHEILTAQKADEALARISPVGTVREAVKDADFVTECVTEDLALKQRIFEELDRTAPPEAILASNTSSLVLAEIGARVKRMSRLIVTHYFNPPHIVPIVEIVPSPFTDPVLTDKTCALMTRLGKTPLRLKKALPGFLVNRVQSALAREALSLLEQEVASVEEIDKAIRGVIGFRLAAVGPLEVMDFGGLDTWLAASHNLTAQISSRTGPPAILAEKVARGELGVKSGRGFYDWGGGITSPLCAAKIRRRDEAYLSLLKLFYL